MQPDHSELSCNLTKLPHFTVTQNKLLPVQRLLWAVKKRATFFITSLMTNKTKCTHTLIYKNIYIFLICLYTTKQQNQIL